MGTTQWVRLGDYIEIVNSRNVNNLDYPILGINKDKTFMHTVANTTDLDKSKYSLLAKGLFVFSGMQTGRDVCIRIALYENDSPVLISPAYTLFKLKDEETILSKYFFMFFNRMEMDRYGWFLSDSSIRSNLDWERFCDIKIPCPSIEVQRELVAAYNGLKSLAEENEAMLEPLAAACQAFVADCKEKYPAVVLGEYIEECDERNAALKYSVEAVKGISIEKKLIDTKADMKDVSLAPYKVMHPMNFCYVTVTSRNGGKISLALNDTNESYIVSSSYVVFRCKGKGQLLPEYLFLLLSRSEFDRYARFNSWGSARETFDFTELSRTEIPLPPMDIQEKIVSLYRCYDECKKIATEAHEQLKTICPALIQRAAQGEKRYNSEKKYKVNTIAEQTGCYKVAEP